MKEPHNFALWNPALRGAYRKGYEAGKAGDAECPYEDKRNDRGAITWSRSFVRAWQDGFMEGKKEEAKGEGRE